jgi:transposase
VDKWHLVALANSMVTEIRQRVTRDLLGRRVNRRLLLTGAEHLSAKQWNRLWRSFEVCDPTKDGSGCVGAQERLRLLLREREPWKIRRRLADFFEAAIIKQVKRTGCGYRNMINYQRRILSHIAVDRKDQQHERDQPR